MLRIATGLLPIAWLLSLAGAQTAVEPTPDLVGPMLGHVDHQVAVLWMRPAAAGRYTLRFLGDGAPPPQDGEARPEHDLCVRYVVDDLAPDTEYRYTIHRGDELLVGGPSSRFRTAARPDVPGRTVLVFGSCAASEPSSVWSAIALRDPDGLVLLGDTPYVDTTDLAVARRKQRRFL